MRLLKRLGKVIFWRYSRGSWQYDILCLIILLFIFATPPAVFNGSYFTRNKPGETIEDSEEPADRVVQGDLSLCALPEYGFL